MSSRLATPEFGVILDVIKPMQSVISINEICRSFQYCLHQRSAVESADYVSYDL